MEICQCYIHSLKQGEQHQLGETTILKWLGDNDYLAEYNGIKCHTIIHPFAGRYFVDDVYGIIREKSGRGGGDDGMGIYRQAGVQYAYFGRNRQGFRSCGARDDGALIQKERLRWKFKSIVRSGISRNLCFSGCLCGSSFFLCWRSALPPRSTSFYTSGSALKSYPGCASSARPPLPRWALSAITA